LPNIGITEESEGNGEMCCSDEKPSTKTQRGGKMFSMTLCDRDSSSTIRAVFFDEGVYKKFQPTKTYDMKDFKVKKGFGGYSDMEIVVSAEAQVDESVVQFPIEKSTFKINQILRREQKMSTSLA
jgi:hypothetical protein